MKIIALNAAQSQKRQKKTFDCALKSGKKTDCLMKTRFESINVLRWHYGMIGQPRSDTPPSQKPFEVAFGHALGTDDPADFECLCPVLIFNRWDPHKLMEITPEANMARLRLAAAIGIFFTDYSRLGIPWAMDVIVALKIVAKETQSYTMVTDPWSDPKGEDGPDGFYFEFFKPYGLYVNWPLADFLKQYHWAMQRNHTRVRELQEETAIT